MTQIVFFVILPQYLTVSPIKNCQQKVTSWKSIYTALEFMNDA